MEDSQPSAVVPEPDEQVVGRVLAGNAYDFRIIVERYTPKLERYAHTYIFTHEQREDLLQDIFLKAYMHLRDYDSRRRFSPWIYRIAHNVFINAIRSKSRARVFSVDWDMVFPHPSSRERADTELLHKESALQVTACLERIPPKYREPLALYYLEDMDYQSISQILRIPVSTVGVRLNRGRSLLRKAWASIHPPV